MSKNLSLLEQIKFNEAGLVPVVVQEAETNQVLMHAWMNLESLTATIETKAVTYWSRSWQELWVKGSTSGNTQELISLSADCDFDTLLAVVKQTGSACHTGSHSCFDLSEFELD